MFLLFMKHSVFQAGNSDTRAPILISLCITATCVHTGSNFYLRGCGDIPQTKQRTHAYPFASHSHL